MPLFSSAIYHKADNYSEQTHKMSRSVCSIPVVLTNSFIWISILGMLPVQDNKFQVLENIRIDLLICLGSYKRWSFELFQSKANLSIFVSYTCFCESIDRKYYPAQPSYSCKNWKHASLLILLDLPRPAVSCGFLTSTSSTELYNEQYMHQCHSFWTGRMQPCPVMCLIYESP